MHSVPEKLAILLGSPPGKKADVAQALAEIGKVLDLQWERQGLITLNLICDWAVQGKLDPERARNFLILLDDRLGHYDPDDPDNSPGVDDALDTVSFSLLRDQLEEFCERLDLPVVWTCDDAAWDRCIALLAEALSSPLKMNRKNSGFTRLKEAVLSIWKVEDSVVGKQPGPVFGFKWECTLDDGRTFSVSRVELPAAPDNESSL